MWCIEWHCNDGSRGLKVLDDHVDADDLFKYLYRIGAEPLKWEM